MPGMVPSQWRMNTGGEKPTPTLLSPGAASEAHPSPGAVCYGNIPNYDCILDFLTKWLFLRSLSQDITRSDFSWLKDISGCPLKKWEA